jgi:hypothetical protein
MRATLRRVNTELFENAGLNASKMHSPYHFAFETKPYALACLDAVDEAEMGAGFAPVETVGNFALTTLVGIATANTVQGLGATDEKGNPTVGNRAASAAAGFGADLASGWAVTELIGSKRTLKKTIDDGIAGSLRSLQVKGKNSSVWVAPMLECSLWEHTQTEEAIFRTLGIEKRDAHAKLTGTN